MTEVRFYDILRSGLPVFADMLRFLSERGFELYDVAMLGSRPSDGRMRIGDVVFVKHNSPLATNVEWE